MTSIRCDGSSLDLPDRCSAPTFHVGEEADVGMAKAERQVVQDDRTDQAIRRGAQDDHGQMAIRPPPWLGHRCGCEASRECEQAHLLPGGLHSEGVEKAGKALLELCEPNAMDSRQPSHRVH